MARGRGGQQKAKPTKIDKFFHDPGRPRSPYTTGTRWAVQSHDPPRPFGDGYTTKHRRGPDVLARMLREQLPQSVFCLLNPPPGQEPAGDAQRVFLEIIEEIRVHVGQGAQVAACRVRGGTGHDHRGLAGRVVVAKIYDPMYYYYNGKYDVIELADMEYSREAAAYEHLLKSNVDGKLLPNYYGSYTVSVPLTPEQEEILTYYENQKGGVKDKATQLLACTSTPTVTPTNTHTATTAPGRPVQRSRQVRLILTDRVEGEAMRHQLVFGSVRDIPLETRLEVVGTSMEAYAQLYFYGVVHGDLAPRNIFLRDVSEPHNAITINADGTSTYTPRIRKLLFHRFVDLGLAYVLGDDQLHSECPRQVTRRPCSPIRLFWQVFDSGATNMYQWLPDELRNTHTFQSWMLQRWYGDPRFEPIGREPQPSKDRTPWETGKATTKIRWPGEDKAKAEAQESQKGSSLEISCWDEHHQQGPRPIVRTGGGMEQGMANMSLSGSRAPQAKGGGHSQGHGDGSSGDSGGKSAGADKDTFTSNPKNIW